MPNAQVNNAKEALNHKIILLEIKREQELAALKNQFYSTCESLKPINLVKDSFKELVQSSDLKGDILDTTLSLATGYLSKKVITGFGQTPIKNFFGTLFQIGITNVVSKNIVDLKSEVLSFLKRFKK